MTPVDLGRDAVDADRPVCADAVTIDSDEEIALGDIVPLGQSRNRRPAQVGRCGVAYLARREAALDGKAELGAGRHPAPDRSGADPHFRGDTEGLVIEEPKEALEGAGPDRADAGRALAFVETVEADDAIA